MLGSAWPAGRPARGPPARWDGIVPWGGVALLRSATALDTLDLDGDQQLGVQIIRRALEEPMR